MKITNLNTKKYERFFAFGCSVTNYKWPTWADIIGRDIKFYENWGEQGGGNTFIFNSVMEANARYNFTKNDLVIVFWSTKEREDRYLNNKWFHATPSNIESKYGSEWIQKFYFDSRSFLIRDVAAMQAVQDILSSKECDWAMLSWYEFFNSLKLREELKKHPDKKLELLATWSQLCREVYQGGSVSDLFDDADVIKLYQSVFKNISGIYRWFEEDIVENKSHSREDDHPLPCEALQFLDWVWPNNTISSEARNFVLNYDPDTYVNNNKIQRL
jgi:hypothetical protein